MHDAAVVVGEPPRGAVSRRALAELVSITRRHVLLNYVDVIVSVWSTLQSTLQTTAGKRRWWKIQARHKIHVVATVCDAFSRSRTHRPRRTCSCQKPRACPSSCTTVPNSTQPTPRPISCWPSPCLPTYDQHLATRNAYSTNIFWVFSNKQHTLVNKSALCISLTIPRFVDKAYEMDFVCSAPKFDASFVFECFHSESDGSYWCGVYGTKICAIRNINRLNSKVHVHVDSIKNELVQL